MGDELAPRDDEAPSIAVGLFFLALVVLSLLLAVRL